MWPFGRKKSELVTISLTPQNITFSWIEQAKGQDAKQTLIAYERIPLNHFEFAQAILFNPTVIKNHILSFFKKHNLQKKSVALSVSGPKVVEKVTQTKNSSPTTEDYNIGGLEQLNWDAIYLCPSQQNGFDFFVCGIKPEYLFSYQLLALASGITLITITTEELALLHLYKCLQGNRFRQAQLSLDLVANKYNIKSFFNANSIKSSLNISKELKIDLNQEYPFLSTNLGLFLYEGTL